jgi:hypothetical protein
MVTTVIRRIGRLQLRNRWFAESVGSAFSQLIVYRHASSLGPALGYKRLPCHTKIVDLRWQPEEILAAFDRGTQYDIRRAQKDGVCCEMTEDLGMAAKFYDEFAEHKRLRKLGATLADLGSLLQVSVVAKGGWLAAHYYIVDPEIKRVRLLHSASLRYSADNPAHRQLIGRANRYLHWQDILHYRKQGMTIYDFGGYEANATDPEIRGVAEFKDSFGGRLMEESNYVPLWLYWWGRIRLHDLGDK